MHLILCGKSAKHVIFLISEGIFNEIFDLSCIIRINIYPAWIFIYIKKFHKFHQFFMYRNVAIETPHHRMGQNETAQTPKRLRPYRLRDRNGQTEWARPKSRVPVKEGCFLSYPWKIHHWPSLEEKLLTLIHVYTSLHFIFTNFHTKFKPQVKVSHDMNSTAIALYTMFD